MTPEELFNRILETMDDPEGGPVRVSVKGWPAQQVKQLKNRIRYRKFTHWQRDQMLDPYTLRTSYDPQTGMLSFYLTPGRYKGINTKQEFPSIQVAE